MSTDTAPVEQPEVTSGDEKQKKDSVKYDSYLKVLGEKKKVQQEREELAAKLKEYEQKELESKGKQTELIESLRTELKSKDDKLSKAVQTFAMKQVEAQIASEASKQGCIDLKSLPKFINFASLEVDPETFSVNQDDLKREIERATKEHWYLFKKEGPKINDLPPGNVKVQTKEKSLNELSKDELIQMWKRNANTN